MCVPTCACPPLPPGHVPRSVSMLVVEALRLRVQPSQDVEHTPVRSRAFEMSARERCSGGCMWRGQAGAGGGGDGTPSPTRFRSKGSLEGGCPIFKTSGVFGQERCCRESRRSSLQLRRSVLALRPRPHSSPSLRPSCSLSRPRSTTHASSSLCPPYPLSHPPPPPPRLPHE